MPRAHQHRHSDLNLIVPAGGSVEGNLALPDENLRALLDVVALQELFVVLSQQVGGNGRVAGDLDDLGCHCGSVGCEPIWREPAHIFPIPTGFREAFGRANASHTNSQLNVPIIWDLHEEQLRGGVDRTRGGGCCLDHRTWRAFPSAAARRSAGASAAPKPVSLFQACGVPRPDGSTSRTSGRTHTTAGFDLACRSDKSGCANLRQALGH